MRNKNYFLIGITVLFIAFFALSVGNQKEIEECDSNFDEDLEIETPREITDTDEISLETPKPAWAGSMNNITIDELGLTVGSYTWDQAKNEVWCTQLPSGVYVIENVTIDASTSPTGNGILINNSNDDPFIIRNCTITNANGPGTDHHGYAGGIKLINCSRGTIFNNTINDGGTYGCGILLYDESHNITVEENIVYSNDRHGILAADYSYNITIKNNTVTETSNHGIYLYNHCYNITVRDNTANGNGGYGIFVFTNCQNNTITNNTANGNNNDGIRLETNCHYNNLTGNIAIGNSWAGIRLQTNSDFNLVSNNHCNYSVSWDGIQIENGCDNNTIIDNIVTNNGRDGIRLYSGCLNNTIENNTANGNGEDGIRLYSGCLNNTIENNTANGNGEDGIRLYNTCSNNIITNNTANGNNQRGISIFINSHNNTIINNNLCDNDYEGIYLENNCDDNKIIHNNASNTAVGYYQNNGIILKNGCDNNLIENNTCNDNEDRGIDLNGNCNNNFIINNTCNDNSNNVAQRGGIVIRNNCHNNIIGENTCKRNGEGIYLYVNCDDNIISYNIFDNNNYRGIYLHKGCDNNTIFNNTATNNQGNEGIVIAESCNDNNISQNYASGNALDGIALITSDYNTIFNNTCNNNFRHGTYYDRSDYNNISYNTANGNGDSGEESGIYLYNSDNNLIHNNTANGNYYSGIYLYSDCTNNNITNNFCDENDQYGIMLYTDCYNNNITGNIVINNVNGIYLYDCSFNEIKDNNVYGNSGNGTYLRNSCHNNTISHNDCSENGLHGIVLFNNCDNNTISINNCSENGLHGIVLFNSCDNNTIEENELSDNDWGIELIYSCLDNKILSNNVTNNEYGIWISSNSNDNLIQGNNCSFNTDTNIVVTGSCHYNIIDDNYISNSITNDGISFYPWCRYTLITNNIINDNGDDGIAIVSASHGTEVYNNTINGNHDTGIWIGDSTGSCIIAYNNITNNLGIGVYIQPGCNGNSFYGNNFTGNEDHVYDGASTTYWNNTQIGNYWDNYTGIDADDDGIGDSFHNVYGSKYDELPIWWDAPKVIIIFPELNDMFGNDTFDFEIDIDRANINDPDFQMWYELDNGTLRKTATFTGLTGTINYFLWNNYSADFINITFYANDSRGYIGYMNVTVEKYLLGPIITIKTLGFQGAASFNPINFTIYKSGRELNTTWYRIYNISYWSENYTFEGLTGWLNQNLWTSLLDGPYKIQFFINDSLSRMGKINGTVIKDTVPPDVSILNPSDNDLVGVDAPNINLDVTEGYLHKIWYSFDGGGENFTFEGGIDQSNWEDVENGTITITFWANDTAGNWFTGVSVFLWVDKKSPQIEFVEMLFGTTHGVVPPTIKIKIINEANPNFDGCRYIINEDDSTYYSLTLYGNILMAQIPLSVWDPLGNGPVKIRFHVEDGVRNLNDTVAGTVNKYVESTVAPPPAADDDDDNDDDDDGVDETMDWIIRALLAGAISGSVGISLRIAYSKIKKKREAARAAAAPTVILRKKFQIVHHDFLTPYGKIEQKEFRVGIAQVGLSKTGNLITELYEMTPGGLMRIREDKVGEVTANIKSMVDQAHENNVNILVFPEMTFDLNYKRMVKDVKQWAQDYNMYIITGGYHDIKTKQNICAVFGPEGIFWEQEKHTPATIHFGKHVFTEAIEVHHPPHKLHICATEFGRIAIAICRDFLDMDLRVEIKNCEPPVDLFFNPAYTPVTVDFEATHFDARRAVYAYTFFTNVAEYGGACINTPEKDRTKRQIPPKEEGIIFKDVDLFSLRSERTKWERRQAKEKRYIQSTRS
ncbi:MAG: hypothetical protein EU535_06495 [Promethearchaeota archaeon]|nr:MAG: hypothetical protein EU535_06495 [Candidatus Lokiarchaeota archaeon]